MTESIKAKGDELIQKFKPLVTVWDCYHDIPIPDDEIEKDAAKCSIIAVEEIISAIKQMDGYAIREYKMEALKENTEVLNYLKSKL